MLVGATLVLIAMPVVKTLAIVFHIVIRRAAPLRVTCLMSRFARSMKLMSKIDIFDPTLVLRVYNFERCQRQYEANWHWWDPWVA